MFYTELHGDFLHWIVMREIHRGATLYFFVSSLKFYSHDCHPERSRRLMKMFCTELHGDFLKWIVMREIHRGATLYFFVSSFIHTIVILSGVEG